MAGGQGWVRLAIEHGAKSGVGDVATGLLHGGERRGNQHRKFYVVESDHTDVLWDAELLLVQSTKDERGGMIVCADECIRTWCTN